MPGRDFFHHRNCKYDWRKAMDWPLVLAGVYINDELCTHRFASFFRGGVRLYLFRETGETLVEDVESCIDELLSRVRTGTVTDFETLPAVLLEIVRAAMQRRMDRTVERLLADDHQIKESSSS